MQVIPDPVESGFFRDFLPLLPDEVRGALAHGMDNQLEHLDNVERQKLWNSWLRRYVDLRLIGVPVALSTAETKHMLEWCLHLGPVFAEAVDLVAQMPHEAVFANSIIEELTTNAAPESFPLHCCRLVITALRAEDFAHLHPKLLTLHEKFKGTLSGTPELNAFEELLYLPGWKKK